MRPILANTVGAGAVARSGCPERLRVWREACGRANDWANDWARAATTRIMRETRDDKKRIKE
jgi:hypothetical protein